MLEWASPTLVTTNLMNETIEYREVDNNINETFDFYRLDDPYSNEEFIVENRQYSGFNSYLPEWWKSGYHGGLLIWHHLSSTSQTRSIRSADNDNDVVLEGLPNVSDGDRGDPFPGITGNTAITPYTTPNTNTSNGSFTGLAITNISSSSTAMTADIYTDFPPAAPQNLIISNAGQNGQNVILSWDVNTEPDLSKCYIYRKVGSGNWENVDNTTNTTWTDPLILIDTSGPIVVQYRVTAVDNSNQESNYSNTVSTNANESFKYSDGGKRDSGHTLPKEIAIYQNYPNPFNSGIAIRFALPERSHVVLKIYNLLGEIVRTIVQEDLAAGFHTARWDGRDEHSFDLPSGVYVYRFEVRVSEGLHPSFATVKKLTMLK